ncbi:MAG: 23S ribosomal RNA methyltransferase Erm [Anaerolineae bacterium]
MSYPESRAQFGQNFLVHGKTVRKLVRLANYTKDDHVIEIGPGDGIITRELAEVVGRVTAIEIDAKLIPNLTRACRGLDNIEIIQHDFLGYKMPETPFSIFSNIPFNVTAQIMQKLFWERNCPTDVYFIMQKEVVEKFVGEPTSTESSAHFQPWFWFKQVAHLDRFEFRPVPSINAGLIHMHQRERPLLDHKHKKLYTQFVSYGFRAWKRNLKIGYKNIFTYAQWKRLAKNNGFAIESIPSDLNVQQWVAVFEYFLEGVPVEKQRLVRS